MRTSTSRLLVLASAAVLVLAGCTPDDDTPDFSTDGALTVADLPDGSWTGPYERWTDAPIGTRPLRCQVLTTFWAPSETPVKKGTAAYADGDTVVWSLAYELPSEADADETMTLLRTADTCVPDPADPDYELTIEDDGTTFVAKDHNTENDRDITTELAVRQDGASLVGVLVSYETSDPPEVTAEGLLDRAVEVSADIQPVE